MKNIGKYEGIPCYTCTNTEWKDCYDKGNDNGKQIFIIDGVMVRNNKIIGYYDGKHVEDIYNERPYFVATATKDNTDVMNLPKQYKKAEAVCDKTEKTETAVAVSSYEELVKQDINFGKYSTVVDQFFVLLDV